MKNLLLLACLLLGSTLLAQKIAIEYKNPIITNLCDTVSFEVTAKNLDVKNATNCSIYLELANGLNYLSGSVTNASVNKITSPKIFEFNINDVAANNSQKITFKAYTDCAALTELNKGALFSNVIIVRYGANEEAILTEPYPLESPLPIIVAMTDPYMKGIKNDILDRKIVIENTRLGILRAFDFEDNHSGGMTVTSADGTTTAANASQLHLHFGAADFKKIGNKDQFFDYGEQIVINEKILITDCGDAVPKSTSKLNIIWGCGKQICNTEKFTAVVDILRSNFSPKLKLEPFYQIARDYCAKTPSFQGVIVPNVGQDTAYNIVVKIKNPNTFLVKGTIKITQDNVVKPITPTLETLGVFVDCNQSVAANSYTEITIPKLAPGKSIKLQWDYLTCAKCGILQPIWEVDVAYYKTCPKNELLRDSVLIKQDYAQPNILTYTSKGVVLKDGETIDGTMIFDMSLFKDSTGVTSFHYELPCGMKWISGPMKANGINPLSFNVSADGRIIDASYPMPLPDSAVGSYTMQFVFDPACHNVVQSYFSNHTDCNNLLPLHSDYFTQSIKGLINSNTKIFKTEGCGIDFCQKDVIFDIDVTKNITITDTLSGYGSTNVKFERCNFGLADNDNDRNPDASGSIDISKIKKNHFINGDTALISIKSQLNAQKDSTFEKASLHISFETHSLDFDKKPYGNQNRHGAESYEFEAINLKLKVWNHKTNEYYDCTLPTVRIKQDTTFFRALNVFPLLIYNTITRMVNVFDLDAKTLIGLPNNYLFSAGDSILVDGKYKFNFKELRNSNDNEAVAKSMRLNAGVSLYNKYNESKKDIFCSGNELKFHTTGIGIKQNIPKYGLLDCYPTVSDTLKFSLGVIQTYPNFFPYEFRSFAKIPTLDIELQDPNLEFINANAKVCTIQGGNVFATNQNLPITKVGSSFYSLDLSGFQNVPIDEGFSVTVENTFQTKCQKKIIDGFNTYYNCEQTNPVDNNFVLDFNLPIPPDYIFKLAYNELTFTNSYADFNSFDNSAIWELAVTNPSKYNSPFPYMYFTDIKGLSNIKVFDQKTGVEIIPQNGLYQLPDEPSKGLNYYNITAINNTCEEAKLVYNYGWNCSKITHIVDNSCFEKKDSLFVTPTPGEVELKIESPQDTMSMCEPTAYFNLDISSVRFGAVFNPTITLTLPNGLSVAPNSAQIAYPANSGNFVNIPDPKILPSGGLGWNIADVEASIKKNGLQGVGQKPNNVARLRFKALTNCGFLAGTNWTAKAEGFEVCGTKTNEITRASKPIFLDGVNPLYKTKLFFKPLYAGDLKCDQVAKFNIRSIGNGTIGDKDSIYVYMPLHVKYIKYDKVNNNSPVSGPDIEVTATQQILKWKMPKGVGPGAYVGFDIYTSNWGTMSCKNDEISIRTIQRQEVNCTTSGVLCTTNAISGEATQLAVKVAHPNYVIKPLKVTYQNGKLDFTLDLENVSSADSVKGMTLDVYSDANGNKLLDSGDILLGSVNYSNNFANAKTVNLTGTITSNIPSNQLCKLLFVADKDKNCACQTSFAPINDIEITNELKQVCSGTPTLLGLDNQANTTYIWTPAANLSCSNCANPTFTYINTSDQNSIFNTTLVASAPNCKITLNEKISVYPKPKIINTKAEICKGKSITLTASDGTNYNWLGVGITNSNQATQTVSPSSTSSYKVTITDVHNCIGIDSILVKVGGGTGMIKDTICLGQKVTYNGTDFKATGKYSITYPIANCDSTFILELTVLDTLQQDEIILTITKGDSVQLVIDPKFNVTGYSFLWTPDKYLSCNTCKSPFAKPINETIYTLKATSPFGCMGTALYKIIVNPGCNSDGIEPVKVFLPNGNEDEDKTFRFVGLPKEGIKVKVKIFNRWSEIVYSTDAIDDPRWDGTYNNHLGEEAPPDVYKVIYEIFCGEKSMKPEKVDVTLMR